MVTPHNEPESYLDAIHEVVIEAPIDWNEGWVLWRMSQAYAVLAALPSTAGPKRVGSAWPSIYRDLEEVKAGMVCREQLRWRPSATDVSMMEEALLWPMLHLTDTPMLADSITLWASCHATGREVATILRRRKMKVAHLVAQRQITEDAARLKARRAAATECALWANQRLSAAATQAQKDAIRHNAHIRFERATSPIRDVKITAAEVDKTRVTSRTNLDRWRKQAAKIIAANLTKEHVPVR